MNKNEFLEAAENAGLTCEYADSKIDAYLETRGDDATPEHFATWLRNEFSE